VAGWGEWRASSVLGIKKKEDGEVVKSYPRLSMREAIFKESGETEIWPRHKSVEYPGPRDAHRKRTRSGRRGGHRGEKVTRDRGREKAIWPSTARISDTKDRGSKCRRKGYGQKKQGYSR